MKSMAKIFARYAASAVGITLSLLVLNFAVLIGWLAQSKNMLPVHYSVHELASSLTKQQDNFILSEAGADMLYQQNRWAMLLDENGAVIWSENLPEDVPLHYSLSDVASFTRWYLQDYPVYVWQHPHGLLVLGSPKGSIWKHGIEIQEKIMSNMPAWLSYALMLNSIAAVLLALLFGFNLFRSLQRLIKGIDAMAENQPVALSTGGLLGDLADKLNQASAQLKRQEEILQKRDNARTTWIAGVSHDIRTPLSMVMGYASQLEDNALLPDAEREQAGIIRKESEKIKALINNLNLASKLEYNMHPLQTSSVNPAALMRRVITDILNHELPDGYSIELNVESKAQGISILGDEELLRRAISNLINNSIRHNPDGCAITVSVEKSSVFCCITVADNGAGFPQQILSTSEDLAVIQKHGLGLTIVRQIIKLHGGTVTFKNLPETGCLVALHLPVYARQLGY